MKNSNLQFAIIALTLLLAASSNAFSQTSTVEFPPSGSVVTLYAFDAQLATLSLLDGKSGMVIRDYVLYNRDSHVAFDIYGRDSLRVGIQGGERGAIVDLGSADDLQGRYGYKETVGKTQGFASIHRDGSGFVILRDYSTREFQPLKDANQLSIKAESNAGAPIVAGHIYLIRIVDRETEVVCAKLRVLAFNPGQSVTVRWERL